MGAPKSIDLGDGLRREVSYEELKSLLAKHGGIYNPQSWDLLQRLFPVELESERWGCYLETKVKGAPLFPYRYTHKDIVQMARRPRRNARKGLPQNRVTDFTRWIYDVIYESPPNPASLLDGKNRERDVAEKKQLPRLNGRSEWEKIYCDPLDEKPEALEISLLTVQGNAIYGAPDYVFRNKTNGTILIIEIKVSDREVPSDGWPNLRAQLWAYGHIDRYFNSTKDIILIGEIWGRRPITLLHTIRWRLSEPQFYKENEELFEIYQNWV